MALEPRSKKEIKELFQNCMLVFWPLLYLILCVCYIVLVVLGMFIFLAYIIMLIGGVTIDDPLWLQMVYITPGVLITINGILVLAFRNFPFLPGLKRLGEKALDD